MSTHDHDGHEHTVDHANGHDAHQLWPEGFWAQPPRLGQGLGGHGAVDDFNVGRAPGPIHVNRKREGGFSGIQTFAKLPVCLTPEDLVAGRIDVAVCGVPWDSTATGRSGTSHGPLAIRSCDYKGGYGRPHYSLDTHVDALEVLNCCDYGDAPVSVGNTPGTFEGIRKFVGTIVDSGAIPVIMGGDHGITWPCATAVADHYGYGKVGIVHFDAHADTGTDMPGSLASHGTPMRKLIESGAVPGRNFVQVGLRGYWPEQETLDWMKQNRMRTHFMAEIDRFGFDRVLERAIDEALDQADHLYLSVDVDVCDPAYAPGTGTPEPGGLTSNDLLRAVRRLSAEVGLAGLDVVEVSPPYDDRGAITALLANRVLREALTGTAMRRLGLTEPDYLHPEALDHGQPASFREAVDDRSARTVRTANPTLLTPFEGAPMISRPRMITRRRASLAAAAAASAAMALAGCGSGSGGDVGPVSTASAPTTGVLKLGFNADPGQPPDPDVYYAGNGLALTTNLYEGLVQYSDGSDTKIVPDLATSWSASSDNTVFTFHLRHGVTFHDGTPFTSAAVQADFERRLAVNGGPAYMAMGVKSFATPDRYTSVITLDKPNSAFLAELASPYGVRMISPTGLAKYAGKDHTQTYLTTHDLGTGPYALTEAKVDSRYVMKAYPGYWGAKPTFKEVDFTVYTDTSAMQLALNNGALDAVISALPSSALGAYEKQTKLKVYRLPTMQVGVLYMNPHKTFLATAAARTAMFDSVDWKSVIKEVVPNTDTLASGAYSEGALPAGAAPAGIAYDPSLLSAYVGKLPKGTTVTLGYQVGDDDDAHIDNLIAAQLDALGMKATVTGYQTSVIFGTWFGHPQEAPDIMVASSTWPDADSPYLYGHVFWDPSGGLNFMDCSSPAATSDLAAGLQTGSQASYVAAAKAIQADECTPIFAYASDFVIAQPWLGGVAAAHSGGEPYTLAFNKLTITS